MEKGGCSDGKCVKQTFMSFLKRERRFKTIFANVSEIEKTLNPVSHVLSWRHFIAFVLSLCCGRREGEVQCIG